MEQEIKCHAARTWSGWEGKITILYGEIFHEAFRTGIIRETKTEALQDAERMKEEIKKGQR